MGISVQASGIMVEKNKYYLVNLNADPSLNELLVYYLKVIADFVSSEANTDCRKSTGAHTGWPKGSSSGARHPALRFRYPT